METQNNVSLTNVISTAIQIPGVKVNREAFLREQFKGVPSDELNLIVEKGTVEAKCSRKELNKKATKLINDRTLGSTSASFLAGLPGGLAMAATIPADMLQFYGVALRLAQELAYLYGEADLWRDDILDRDRVTNQLILYCGVMLGASGAAQTVRVLSSSLAKQALKKIPQKALTKTFYYPIVKSIAKAFGAKMTKEVFAKGVSKAVPIIGGVVSGGITLVTMRPMGIRLAKTLDEAHFDYTQAEFEEDWSDIMEVCEEDSVVVECVETANSVAEDSVEQKANHEAAEEHDVKSAEVSENEPVEKKESVEQIMEKIKKAKEMLDMGIIDEAEFAAIKAKLIAQI